MGVRVIRHDKLEGTYLIFNRDEKSLRFLKRKVDDKKNFCVGQVVNGTVAGKKLAYWIKKARTGKV
jgi:hypothetical protein